MDTRDKNIYFPHHSVTAYLNGYMDSISNAMNLVDKEKLEQAAHELFAARSLKHRIFIAGNGGSAAIAEHASCDLGKGCHLATTLQMISLVSNTALLTAVGNDIGYDSIFSYPLDLAEPKPGEVLILISSSGNSPNIIKAAELALKKKMTVIGFSGFDGGKLKVLADIAIHVPIANYGIVEDCHQMILHVLAQSHYLNLREPS